MSAPVGLHCKSGLLNVLFLRHAGAKARPTARCEHATCTGIIICPTRFQMIQQNAQSCSEEQSRNPSRTLARNYVEPLWSRSWQKTARDERAVEKQLFALPWGIWPIAHTPTNMCSALPLSSLRAELNSSKAHGFLSSPAPSRVAPKHPLQTSLDFMPTPRIYK